MIVIGDRVTQITYFLFLIGYHLLIGFTKKDLVEKKFEIDGKNIAKYSPAFLKKRDKNDVNIVWKNNNYEIYNTIVTEKDFDNNISINDFQKSVKGKDLIVQNSDIEIIFKDLIH